jgi:hypothetical protein
MIGRLGTSPSLSLTGSGHILFTVLRESEQKRAR